MRIHRVMGSLTNATVPLSFLLFLVCILQCCHAADIMTADQSIVEGQFLISAGGITVLGIWNPGNSQNRHLGIWFKVDPTPVWIANRENPLTDSSGVLKIDTNGNLVLSSGTGRPFWSSSNASAVSNKPRIAQLLDSGNLVLIEDHNIVWQSFDYPSDTFLSGMKVRFDRKTGINRVLTSWRSLDDPFPGNFSAGIEPSGFPQLMTWDKSVRFFRGGPWNGIGFSGMPEMKAKNFFNFSFVNNQDEISYSAKVLNTSIIEKLVLYPTGVFQRLIWSERNKNWISFAPHPKDQCDYYGVCGPFAYCNSDDWPVCSCLEGFEPKSPPDWVLKDFTQGCVRSTSFKCGIDDGFSLLRGMKLPDTSLAHVDESLSLKDCESRCLEDCSCAAYANSNINGGGTGCVIWTGNLVDLRSFPVNGDDFYIRMDSSKLGAKKHSKGRVKRIIEIVTITIVLAVILMSFSGFCLWKKKLKEREQTKIEETSLFGGGRNISSLHNLFVSSEEGRNNDQELQLFDLSVVIAATNNFSYANKLGEGGFGLVHKGVLHDGQVVAVKRLSLRSRQGKHEFKNEVILISKLQHRNLVKLLGCCIQGEENILIYEYMPNKSLDFFLFDKTKSVLLDWAKRYNIIIGIARGLLYLHQDSRLRIIHRDLKASNILLDDQMNPKISDFGLARMFEESQIQANTRTIVGTYGYMAPEYIMDGIFSMKSDIFSFGVLLLEIISGRSNRGFNCSEQSLNLLGHAWTLWKECRSLELLDTSIGDSCSTSKLLRFIQVGLLCVQESGVDRPDMASVVSMLSSETTPLPLPGQPAFMLSRPLAEMAPPDSGHRFWSINEVSTSVIEPR